MTRTTGAVGACLVLFALALVGCKDASPPKPDTPLLAIGERATGLRAEFDAPLTYWKNVTGRWELRGVGKGGVLAQTSTAHGYPLTLWQAQRFLDVDASVEFKPISGNVDASGGIVFRARDESNYYVVRANSLEDNFRLYTVIDGDRSKIAGAFVKPPQLGQWHSLRVIAVGEHIQAYLDGVLLIDHHDDTFAEGWVGLWTKADAVTEFDQMLVRGTARLEPGTR